MEAGEFTTNVVRAGGLRNFIGTGFIVKPDPILKKCELTATRSADLVAIAIES